MARLDVNLSKMAAMLLPPILRGKMLQSFILSAVSALDEIQNTLYQYHMEDLYGTRYRIAHNSQVCSLRGVLNDMYDTEQRRITIDSVASRPKLYLHYDREMTGGLEYQKVFTPQTVFFDYEQGGGESKGDFTVFVPADLQSRDLALRATIDKYKLASKTYNIQYV